MNIRMTRRSSIKGHTCEEGRLVDSSVRLRIVVVSSVFTHSYEHQSNHLGRRYDRKIDLIEISLNIRINPELRIDKLEMSISDDSVCDTAEFACVSLNDNVWAGILLVIGLSVVTHVVSVGVDILKERAGHMARVILPIVLEEMSVLGMFSFVFFLFQYFGAFPEEFSVYVDFLHLSLFITLLIYLCFVSFLSWGRFFHLKEWSKFQKICVAPSKEQVDTFYESLSFFQKRHFKTFEAFRLHMIRFHSLADNFDYALYLEFVINYLFEYIARVGWRTGAIMSLWLAFAKVFHTIAEPKIRKNGNLKTNEYLYPASMVFNYILLSFSLWCLIKLQLMLREIQSKSSESTVLAEGASDATRWRELSSPRNPEDAPSLDEEDEKLWESFRKGPTSTSTEWWKRLFPIVFEQDRYLRNFPFTSPNSVMFVLQMFLLSQGLTWTVFFFILVWIEEFKHFVGIFFYLVPGIMGVATFSYAFPKYAMFRFSGPLANHLLLSYVSNGRVKSECKFG